MNMTNYEKVMQEMTVEKLADLGLCDFCPNSNVDDYCSRRFNCKEESKKWLEQEDK